MLDWNAANLRGRWKVKTTTKTVLPIGTPTTPTSVRVVEWSLAWIRNTDLRGTNDDRQDRPGENEVRWVRNVVGLPSPPFPYPDDAGHLIAHTLGGHGRYDDTTQPNIFPQDTTVNTGGRWVESERRARTEAAEPCKKVCVRVTLRYSTEHPWSGYPARPRLLDYEVWSDGMKVVNALGIINIMRQNR